MKLFDRFKKKSQEGVFPEDNEVIVPDHAKTPQEKKAAAKEIEEVIIEDAAPEPVEVKKKKAGNLFVVNGNYDMGSQLMLSGVMQSGKLKKGMKTKKDKSELTIAEMKISSQTVKELSEGEEGTIFLKYKIFPNVKYDDILEFK